VNFPVFIDLHRKNRVLALLQLFHSTAAICVALIAWQWQGWAVCIVVALLALIVWSLITVLKPTAPELDALRIRSREKLEARSTDGRYLELTLLAGTTAFVSLIVLRFCLEGEQKARSIVLLPAQIPSDQFRVLRVWLRWEAVLRS
jgi:hypothetical protein